MDRFFAASSTQAQLAERNNATMHLSTEVVSVNHSDKLESVTLRNVETGEEYTHECDGIFVFMGQHPGTESFAALLDLDADGYIVTDEDMTTSIPGVFAAGDVR
ncbi:FAD-dependent oxidoreductase, partial [Aduncisulcus paluster]